MNELEPYQDEDCGRCREPLEDQRFSVRIDADPALPSPIELWICERCMDSMTRWMQRRQSTPRTQDREAEGQTPRKGRKKRKKQDRRANYSAVLDRNVAWIHRKHRMILWATIASVAAVIGLIYFAVMSDVVQAMRPK